MTELNIAGYAFVFSLSFFFGGLIGILSLPVFPGRFFVTGLIFAIFATGAGSLIIQYTTR